MNLPEQMDALVLKSVRNLNIEKVPVPEPNTDEVICKVDTVYICGTDPHIIAGDFPGHRSGSAAVPSLIRNRFSTTIQGRIL